MADGSREFNFRPPRVAMPEISTTQDLVLHESKIPVLVHAYYLANRAFRDVERLRLGRRPKGFQGVGTNQRILVQGGEDHRLIPTGLGAPSVRHQRPPADLHDLPGLLPNAFIRMNSVAFDLNLTNLNPSGGTSATYPGFWAIGDHLGVRNG